MTPSLWRLISAVATGPGLRTELVRGAMGVGGLQLLSFPIGLAASILLARGIGPEGFGRYAFITSVVAMFAIPLYLGMPQLLTREVATYHHEGEWSLLRGLLRRAHQWVLLASLVVFGTLGATAAFCATWNLNDRWTLLLIGLPILPFLGLNALRAGTLRGLGSVVLAELPEQLAQPTFHLLVVGALLIAGSLNAGTALVGQLTSSVPTFLLGAYLLTRSYPLELREAAPVYRSAEWARAWVPFTLIVAATTLNSQIGILLLGWLGTDEQIAALRVAERGASLVALSLAIVNMVIAPHITRAYRAGDHRRLQRLSRSSARAALTLAVPIGVPMILLGAPVIALVFGPEYVALTVTPLAVLAGAQLVNVAFGSVGLLLSMSGFERDTLFGQTIALALNAVMAIVLIPPFGADGAAWAAAVGMVTWNVILGIKLVRRLGLRPGVL